METRKDPHERRALQLSAAAALLVGTVGIGVSTVAESDAILLDGMFNLVYFLTGLFTLRVASLMERGDSESFPFGYDSFEPLVNGLKGVLIFGISAMAFVSALEALFEGGRRIEPGPALIYALAATAICGTTAGVLRRTAGRTPSPLVAADASSWMVNAAVSSGVLLTFIGLYLVRGSSLLRYAPYVDPALVLLITGVFVAVPIRMAWVALNGLLGRADPALVAELRGSVLAVLEPHGIHEIRVRAVQPGRRRFVLVQALVPDEPAAFSPATLDLLRGALSSRLRATHADLALSVAFTADKRWLELGRGTASVPPE